MVIRAVQAASKLTPDYEVIVVNDGSRDATAQIADELAEKYPHVRVVHHPVNRGYGGALQTGFRIREVPVHHYHRAFGKSQFFNFRRIAKTGIDVMRLWFALVVVGKHRRQLRPSADAADPARPSSSRT